MSATPDGFPYPPASDALGNGHQWMQNMAEFLDANYVPWTAYTPTLGGVTLGNGVVEGAYRFLFGQVDFHATLTLGTTTAITGTIGVGLPAAFLFADAYFSGLYVGDTPPYGYVVAQESTAPTYRTGVMLGHDISNHRGYLQFDGDAGLANATRPFTWDDPDYLRVRGSYHGIPA